MKKLFVFALSLALFTGFTVSAQKNAKKEEPKKEEPAKDSLLPYQKHAALPAFNILKMDSVTTFNTFNIPKGKPVLLFYFGPECDHCQKLLDKLLPSMDSLSHVRIYMITFANITPLKKFYERNNLSRFKNIEMGRDSDFFVTSWFGARFVPYLAMYDKDKNFVGKFEKEVTMKELYEASHKKGMTPRQVVEKKFSKKK